MEEGAPGFAKQLQAAVDKNESLAGGPMSDEERTAYQSDVSLGNRYLAEVKATPIILPTITLDERFTLHRGDRTIDVRYLGRAHTLGTSLSISPRKGFSLPATS